MAPLELTVTAAAQYFGVSMETPMRMQNSYDITQMRKSEIEGRYWPLMRGEI